MSGSSELPINVSNDVLVESKFALRLRNRWGSNLKLSALLMII